MTVTSPHWRAPDPTELDEQGEPGDPVAVDQAEAEALWAARAPQILTEVASAYQGLITHTDLAARLQADTGVHTRSNPQTWLGRVLAVSSADDVAQGRPPLTSLVVHRVNGTVGAPYDEVLRVTGQDPIEDEVERERHAAEARMECYRWANATLPADGGHSALSPRYDMVLTRGRRKARQEAEPDVCPTCFMAIPPTGVCDNCG
ncbi:hypothetical protein [Nocardioides sp.]|uniref:hypothetical protein n=1 Tax=Nocardioides sp. TaxID=35761 RepID=UPI0027225DCA|nr:hypothetical protein [Nocardioides sp.]MDO9456592.1 hypothetical protein [Nocardioides sp.]